MVSVVLPLRIVSLLFAHFSSGKFLFPLLYLPLQRCIATISPHLLFTYKLTLYVFFFFFTMRKFKTYPSFPLHFWSLSVLYLERHPSLQDFLKILYPIFLEYFYVIFLQSILGLFTVYLDRGCKIGINLYFSEKHIVCYFNSVGSFLHELSI